MSTKKVFYVAWESSITGREEPGDCLALQGPHTLEYAEQIAEDLRFSGLRASAIDCSRSLKYAHVGHEMLETIKRIERAGCDDFERVQLRALIKKAEGK